MADQGRSILQLTLFLCVYVDGGIRDLKLAVGIRIGFSFLDVWLIYL